MKIASYSRASLRDDEFNRVFFYLFQKRYLFIQRNGEKIYQFISPARIFYYYWFSHTRNYYSEMNFFMICGVFVPFITRINVSSVSAASEQIFAFLSRLIKRQFVTIHTISNIKANLFRKTDTQAKYRPKYDIPSKCYVYSCFTYTSTSLTQSFRKMSFFSETRFPNVFFRSNA